MKYTNHLFLTLCFFTSNLQAQLVVASYDIGAVSCSREKGYIDIKEVAGGKAPFSFLWSNGATTEDISTLNAGIYSVTIHDSNIPPREGFAFYVINSDTIIPVADAGIDQQLTCDIKEVVLDGSGSSPGYFYRWSTPNGQIMNTFPLSNIAAKAPGIYYLSVEDFFSGCKSMDTVLVQQSSDMPIANAGESKTRFCSNPALQLDGSASSSGAPGYTYVWQKAIGVGIVSGANTLTPTVDQPGKYFLKVTNQNTGCSSTGSVDVIEDIDNPKIYFQPILVHINCEYDTLPLQVVAEPIGGAFTYQWQRLGNIGHIVSGQGTPNILVDSAGTYVVTVTNTQNGCKKLEGLAIDYNWDTPIVKAGDDVFLGCTDTNSLTLVALNLPGGTPFNETFFYWYDEDGNWLNPSKLNYTFATQGGLYIVKAYDAQSKCYDTDSVFVFSRNNFAQISQDFDTITCAAPVISLNASGSANGLDYELTWSTNNGSIIGDINAAVIQVDSPGLYMMVVKNTVQDCADSAFVSVVLNILSPTANTELEQLLPCEPEEVLLNGTGSSTGGNIQYNWTTSDGHLVSGSQSLSPVADEPGHYLLTVIDKLNGCEASSITIVKSPPPFSIIASADSTSCHETNDGKIEAISPPDFLWSLNGDQFSANSVFEGLEAGEYILYSKDTFGCIETELLTVQEPELLWASLGNGFSMESGSDTVLSFTTNIPANYIGLIEWEENGVPVCSGCLDLPISPTVESNYVLILKDLKGCQVEDALTVKILDAKFYIPNAFSPNGNGENDFFLVFSGDKNQVIKLFQIYSRWGELVFQNTDMLPNIESEGWDGTFKGKPAPEGVYIWHVTFETEDKTKKHLHGDVLLISNN